MVSKRKTWIKVKRGLLQPKHRVVLGECIWLYFHILDRANWETGVVEEWKDEAEADTLEMNIRTLRHQRKKLEKAGYITAEKKQRHQRIIIHRWVDPRKYDGKIINVGVGLEDTLPVGVLEDAQSPNELVLSEDLGVESTNQSTNQSSNQVSTLPLISQNHTSHNSDSSFSQDEWIQVLIAIKLDNYRGRHTAFDKYWGGTGCAGRQDGVFRVSCTKEQQAWLESNGKKIAENVLIGVLGKAIEVKFVVKENVK